MRVLGIDPGTAVTGYGVIDNDGGNLALVICGALTTPRRATAAERLHFLYQEICKVIRQHHPDVLAVEQPFVAKNARTALVIGRAQAMALLAAAASNIPCYEYTPASVKQSVTSYGAGSKAQVQEMVRLQLSLAEAPTPDDAADALAVAITHLNDVHLSNLLSGGN
ncbi:crossover junction endodeoxyribonuclease RuvC [Chloroflexota bacterium]